TGTASEYYNGVPPGTNANSLKDFEADWIRQGGYPGPDLPPVTSPPNARDQVATISGNATSPAIVAMSKRYVAGDEILVCVYPGTLLTVKDFAVATPAMISLPETGTVTNVASLLISRNQNFSGTVTLSTLADAGDTQNPLTSGKLLTPASQGNQPFVYSPNPATPSMGVGTKVDMRNATTKSAIPGIYTLWLSADPADPGVPTKLEPFSVKIGTVTRDIIVTPNVSLKEVATAGGNVQFKLKVVNSPTTLAFSGSVTLSVDNNAQSPLPAGVGSISFSDTSVTPSKSGTQVTLTINTGSMAPGVHRFVVRTSGMNGDSPPRRVTELTPLYVSVSPPSVSASRDYVDVIGFAAMRIAIIDVNTVEAYAISPVVSDLSDARLSRGYMPRLVPW
ncbi:MAG: hypothetical protein M3301_08055, partial [Chloroflexota bacterium]|nr:hypothetical protein [Chloroflexota bacterium]